MTALPAEPSVASFTTGFPAYGGFPADVAEKMERRVKQAHVEALAGATDRAVRTAVSAWLLACNGDRSTLEQSEIRVTFENADSERQNATIVIAEVRPGPASSNTQESR